MKKGVLYAIGAYGMWGFFPLYWKWLGNVPAQEILVHRMVWSLVFVGLLLLIKKDWTWVMPALKDKRTLLSYFVAACLLTVNWYIYIWGVNDGQIVETSLGYFINPLVSVFLGVFFLKETMRPGQWVAVGLAAMGVIYLTIRYGQLPWIALSLATTFGSYGLIKKQVRLNSLQGMGLETAVLFVPALAYILYLTFTQQSSFGTINPQTTLLLACAGIVTAVPLLSFAAAAPRIPLSMLGILQYLAPTLQFLIGVVIYHEPFPITRLIGFGMIWAALLLYSIEGMISYRRAQFA